MANPTSALDSILSLANDLRQRAEALDDPELKLKLADLIMACGDLRAGLADGAVASTAAATETPTFSDDVYWFDEEGPFCPYCWDKDTVRSRLHALEGALRGMGKYQCPRCNAII